MNWGTNKWKWYSIVVVAILVVGTSLSAGVSAALLDGELEERQTISKIRDVTVTNEVDNDGDGYYSNFDLEIEADTDCNGCDDGTEDTEGEYFLSVGTGYEDDNIVNTQDNSEGDHLENKNHLEHEIEIDIENFEEENLDRGRVEFTVYLYEDDGLFNVDDRIDRWEITLRYEPAYED